MKSKAKPQPNLESLVGRDQEMSQILACVRAGKNLLLEGPVGVGKTHLALAAIAKTDAKVFRIDGDSRYTEQKLSGWFDPPAVIKSGYSRQSFLPGPLTLAMEAGGVLFINELNRLPEGVQNILLPAIDEKMISIPRLGEIKASPGFVVIATQNPKEFVATSHLSEAILDRFELVLIDYQTEDEELSIVRGRLAKSHGELERLIKASVRLVRLTRDHEKIKRGASIRAGISIAEMGLVFLQDGLSLKDAFVAAATMALPTRIEVERDAEGDASSEMTAKELVREMALFVLEKLDLPEKKKTN